MTPTLRQRIDKYVRKFFFLEGLGGPQVDTHSSPAMASPPLSETDGNGRDMRERDQGALPPVEAANDPANDRQPDKLQRHEPTLETVLGTDIHTGEVAKISLEDQRLGQYVIGSNGTGKTTLLCNMILRAIAKGFGLCLLEPHSDLVRAVISGIPEHRLRDVYLLQITDAEAPVGINLFSCPQPRTIKTIAAASSFDASTS